MRLYFAYFLFILGLSIFSYLFVDPNLIYFKDLYTGFLFNRPVASLIFFLIVLIFFGFYLLFLHRAKKKQLNLKLLVIINCILLFSYPGMLSFDIFNYIATAKVFFHYHENPYIIMPNQFLGDHLLLFSRATNKITLYGPFWIVATGFPFIFGFGNFLLTLFNFKLLILGFYLALSRLIYRTTGDTFSTAIFALNPLVIIESLLGGHNDVFMMFFAVLSLTLIKKKILTSIFSLIFSIAVKYSSFFLIPVFLYLIKKISKKEQINWSKVYFYSFLSMITIFFLSRFRGEIYPWYAIWFLPFTSLLSNRKTILYVSLALSFGLLLSYIPFMFSGNYFGITPTLRDILSFTPAVIVLVLRINKIWLRKLHF